MKKILTLLTILLFLGGCADYKEVNEMAIVSAIGIDYTDDEFAITLEVLNEKIPEKEQINSYTRTAKDKNLGVAIEKAADLLSHRAYYPHVRLLILGKEVAEEHLQEINDFFLRSTYFRENFNIVVSNEHSAEEILKITTKENPIASSTIMLLLQTNGYASDYAIDKKNYMFLQEIIDFGKDGAISNINVENDNFYIDGLAIFEGYKMANILNNDEAVIYNILRNESVKPVFSLTYEGKSFTISLYDSKSDISITSNTIKIDGTYRVKIMDNGPNFDIKNDKVLEALDEDFSKLLNEKITDLIKKLQKNNSDILYFANTYYIKTRDKNDTLWQHAKIESNTKVVINKKGLVYSIYEGN